MNMHTQTDRQINIHTHTHNNKSNGPFMQISNLGSLFFLAIPSSHPLTLQSALFSVTSVPSSSSSSRYLFFIVALVNSQWQGYWKDPCHPSWPVIAAPISPVLRLAILKHSTITPLYSKSSSYGPMGDDGKSIQTFWQNTTWLWVFAAAYATGQRCSNSVYVCFCTCKWEYQVTH